MFQTESTIVKTTATCQLFHYIDRLSHRGHCSRAANFLILDLSILSISHHVSIRIFVSITVISQVVHQSELANHGLAGRDSAHIRLKRWFDKVLRVVPRHSQNLIVDKVGELISEQGAIDENVVVFEKDFSELVQSYRTVSHI